MVTQQLLDYIKQQLEQGISREQIKNTLLSQGWAEDGIEDGSRKVEASISNDNSSLPVNNLETSQSLTANQSPENQSSVGLASRQDSNDNLENNNISSNNFGKTKLPPAWDLLEKSWQIFKRRWKTFIVFPLIPIVVGLMIVVLDKLFNVSNNISTFSIIFFLLILTIAVIIYFWSIVSLFYAVNDENLSVKGALGQGWYKIIPHKIISYWWISFLSTIVIAGGIILFIVPGIIFSVWFSLAVVVFIAEGIKGMNALLKSREYVRDYWWSIFWRFSFLFVILLVPLFLTVLITYSIWSPSRAVGDLIGNLFYLITLPLSTIYLFQIYYSLRDIKKDFVFTPNRKAKIRFIIVGIIGMLVIPLLLGLIVLVNVNKAGEKAKMASVQGSLSQLRSMGEMYADDHYYSYDGFVGSNCSSGSSDWQKICHQATQMGFLVSGYDSQNSYCVIASSKEKSLCVDSGGYSGVGKCIGQGTKDDPYRCWQKQVVRNNNKMDKRNISLLDKNYQNILNNNVNNKINNISRKHRGILANLVSISPDGQHYAYISFSGKKQSIVLDGKEQRRYGFISDFLFSPDSRHFVYIAQSGNKYFIILDGMEMKKYDWVLFPPFGPFSPDSQHLAYIAGSGNKNFVVLDRREQKKYDTVDARSFSFSPNGQHYAYVVYSKNKQFIVLDGHEQKKYDKILRGGFLFSPDSQHFSYIAKFGSKYFAVLDGEEKKKYDEVWYIAFSPDSRHFAYIAQSGKKQSIVLDGKEQKSDNDILGSLIFSPDGQHFAYIAESNGKQFVVLDGKEQRKYDGIWDLYFSLDSQRLTYVVKSNGQQFVVLDGKEQKKYNKYDEVWDITFSPDSRHLAYMVRSNNKYFVVLDEKEQKGYNKIKYFTFSPNGQHYAYVAYSKNKQFIVLDGHEQTISGGEIYKPHFTKSYFIYNIIQDDKKVQFVSKEVD